MPDRRTVSTRCFAPVLLASALAAVGCQNKEQCGEAVSTARQAIGYENMESARQWREHVYTVCGDDPATKQIDQEIIAKETEVKQRHDDDEKKTREAAEKAHKDALKVFKKFDKLDDEKKTLGALKKSKREARKLLEGLTLEHGKQVDEKITEWFEKREEKLEKKK